ncbi:hypothetical protein L7F22_067934 [Adiantum nelumboides]|nr:hypothetical protein [Adiantum nelumboides]
MSSAMNQAMTLSQPNRPLLIEHLRMREIENGTGHSRRFETILPPLSVSAYTQSNAFGGMSIALIIQAAFHTLSQQESSHWVPYSIMGYFLGPVSTSAPVIIEVENARSSKRFQTRSVRVQSLSSSNNDSKTYKLSFIAMLDFCHSSGHTVHPLTDDILQSSETNSKTLEVLKKGPDAFYDWKTVAIKRQNEQNEKSIKEAVNDYKAIYDQRSKLINMRVDPESLLSKSLSATAPIVKSKEQLKTLKCYEDPSTALEHVWKRPSCPLLPQLEQEDDEEGSIFQNLPWTYDSYSPVDLTLLDPHFGTLALWQTAIDEIHKRGMYVILDNTFATLGDLLGAEGYLNASVPFSPKEHIAIYKTDRVYHDFIFDNSWNEDCQYPRFWNETGFPVDEEVVQSFKGCRNSDFDQYGDTEAFGIYPDYRRQLTKFASVQDRVREWKPSVRAKLENFFCIVIAQLDIDGYRYDKAMQATVDALGEMNKAMRKCAARHGKKNFFLPGEITGGNNLASVYLGRGRQPDMLPPNLTVAIQAGHSSQSYSIRNADQARNDAAAFHYTVYRTLTRHLLMDGNLEAGYDAPANFVDMWNTFLLTNDFTNPNTGEFDPRHMYGTMNQDVFRWPAIKDGIRKQLLGNFITTLLLPGIPLLLWGEEQSFYTLDNTASNYIFGRQPMSAAGAWQTHGCYSLDSTQYYQFPVESTRNGCKDEKVSYDHRDVSSPIRNIFKHFYFLRSQFTVLQDGAWLQQLSNQTWQSILPGSSGVPTEQGLWSVMRSDVPGLNLLNDTTNSLTSVWLLWTNIESTKSFYFNCSDTRISPQTQALLSPFPASTRLRNLLHPYEIVDLQESEQVLGTFNSTVNRTNGCLPFLEMHSFDFKAFVPIEEWKMPPATVTGFYLNGDQRNGHDSRILAKEENPQIGETVSVTILFSRFIDCDSVTKRLKFTSTTVSGRLPKLINNTVLCQAQMIPTSSQHLQNAAPTEWSWSGQLSGVEHGIHRISINATGSIDKFTFRIGTNTNPIIFPRIANYSTSLVRSEALVSGDKVITLAHNADGADLWRYTSNWGSSYSDWMPYSGGDTNITLLDWNGTKEQAWKGTHIRVEYFNRIVGSSDMIQEGDLEKEVGMKRFPHLYWNGPYNDYGFDASINNEVQYRSEDKIWYYKFMNEWPAIGQFNVWGTNPDGLPDQTYVMGDIDGDMVLDRLPPSSLSSVYINITQSPDMMHPVWALHIDDATMKFYLQPTGSSFIQMIIFCLLTLIPFISAFLAVLAFIKSFYKVKFNQLGSTLQEKVSIPPALQRIYNILQPSKRIILSDSGVNEKDIENIGGINKGKIFHSIDSTLSKLGFSSRSRSGSLIKDEESYDQSEQQRKRTVLIATIEYDIEDWNIKVKIGGMGVMAQLMGKALGHQNLIWVVPCIGDVHYPIDTPAEPMRVTILGVDYSIQVQYHFLNNVMYVLLDAPIFRQQTKAEPYPTRMDDINSAIYYSAWNQCIAHTARRFPIDLYHINDYHGCLAPLYLLPQTIPCCFSLHNAEFQGLWPMRTKAECEEVCRVFNLTIEIVRKYVQFGEIFNLLHAGASYLRIHQRGFGAVGVSKKYGSRVHLRYPIFWGLQKVGHLPNPDPTDIGEWKGSTSLQEPICIEEEFENKRPLLREEAQRWAGLEVDSNAELFVFVGRWSVQKGVDLIADVFPKILKQHSNVQLICVGPIIDLYGRFAALKLDHLMKQYPKRVCSKPVFTALPPCVFAGAEFALIPSRDEPFGLVAVEFGRKGALGVGARVGGLGNMPGWWYTVEAMSTSHLLRQFQQAIEEALSSKKHIRALMRARAAKQRFPVAQWLEDLEILQSNSIRIHEECGGKLLNQIQDSQNQIQYPITSSNVVEDSYDNNDLESNLPIPSRLFVSNIKRKPPPAVPSFFSPLRVQSERDIECSSQISEEDFFEALEEEENNNDRFDCETENRIPAIETNLVRETLFSASSSTDVLPTGITDGSLESSRLDSSNSLIKYTDDTETPAIEEEIAFLPQLTSYRSSANLLDANAVLGDSTRRNAYLLQNVDAQFTDQDDLYFSRFSRKLDQASSSSTVKASSTCIEEFLIDSEREWFAETLKTKLNLGAIGRPYSSLSTNKSFSRRNSDSERTGDKTILGRIIADLPLVVRFDIYPDPRILGIITSARCEELLLYYDSYLKPWAGVIPSAQELSITGTRWTSTFLLSTVLYLASRFSNSIINSQEEQVLGMHTRSLAIRAFGCADQSLETLTALHLLTVWKALDDGYSQLYIGYADQIANISRTGGSNGSPLSEKEARNILRIQLFHYVQRSTFQLFYVPLINEIMDQDGFILPFPISSPPPPPLLALERFAAGSSTLLSDWQLCATVEGRSIQIKYRDLLEKHKPGRFGRSRNLSGEQIALLEAFFCEMEAWEYRWRRRRSRISESKRSSRTPVQGEEDKAKTETERYSSTTIEDDQGWIKFEILGNSICLHISSLAFRQCIEVWFETFPQTIFQSIEKALAEMIQRTYQACIDSAIGLLERIVSINPLSLVHMPDTDFIMINYAAMFVVYLLLLPSEVEDNIQKPSLKQLISKEEYLTNLLSGYTTKFREYLGLIKVVKDVVERASQTRPQSTCCFLSSEQFKSLVALFEATIQSPT